MSCVITGGHGDLALELEKALEAEGLDVIAPGKEKLDVCCANSIKDYFSKVEKLELLVCNAGCIQDTALSKMSENDWDHVMQVNLRGALLCAAEAAKKMARQRVGHIIFIGSYAGLHPSIGQANYAAAKSALIGATKSIAQELGKRNVRVNLVLPGFLETKMTSSLSDSARERIAAKHTLGRFNTTERAADFITHLHQKMSHTSGQIFNLDSRIV